MMRPQEILFGPLLTEKTNIMKEKTGVVAFRVDPRANKVQVRQAVEILFKVKVQSVRTERMHGKFKRVGRYAGHRSDWKKAYVTLRPGEKTIEFHETI